MSIDRYVDIIMNMRIRVDFVHHRSDPVFGLFYQLLQKAARKHFKINIELMLSFTDSVLSIN